MRGLGDPRGPEFLTLPLGARQESAQNGTPRLPATPSQPRLPPVTPPQPRFPPVPPPQPRRDTPPGPGSPHRGRLLVAAALVAALTGADRKSVV